MPVGRAIVTSIAEPGAGVARQPLAFELGDLIDVARHERRILVGRRMLDVAVDADRAAVHDAADAGARRRLDDVAAPRSR